MAFVVEDGSVVSGATSYCSEAFFTSYFTDLGDTIMTAKSSSDIQTALMKATLWVDQTYKEIFKGSKYIISQALQWPRAGVEEDGYAVSTDEIPVNLQKAVCEMAKRSFTEDLFSDVDSGDKGIIQITVGPITKKWAPGTYDAVNRYAFVEKLLAGLVYASGGIILAERA